MPRKSRRVSAPPAPLEIVYVLLSDLTTWEQNPRRTDAASKKLARLIAVHGVKSPLVCTRDNVIRKGNTTYKALVILGQETAPVVYVDFPSEEQAALYSIADNRASEFSEWDTGILKELLGENAALELPELEEMSGFTQPEIAGLRDMTLPEDEEKEKKPERITCPECGHVWLRGKKKNRKVSG